MSFTMLFDRKHRVLLVRFGRVLDQEGLDRLQAAGRRFVEAEGRCRAIVDLTAVEKANVPSSVIVALGRQPAVMAGEKRVLVASRPEIFGLVRMFGLNQASTGDEPQVLRNMEEAYAALELDAPDFQPVDFG